MSNPFKKIASNAKETKNKKQWEGSKTNAAIATKTCGSCGAPRPKRSDLRVCAYCGLTYMDVDTAIKTDS